MWCARARAATQGEWAPLEVHLQTPASNLDAYRDFFGSPVYHDAPAFRLVFPVKLLDLRLTSGGDAVLRAYLRPMADALMTKLRAHGSFSQLVRAALLRNIQDGACTIGAVARALALSPRTLQRRLENEGTTFGEVYDLTRRDAVIEQLRNPKVAIKEAAFRAGFSETSTFYRAFRRWTGITPAHYRQSLNMLVA
jgi:AraC-like DNA-binding protein